jgi:hypothetical protein
MNTNPNASAPATGPHTGGPWTVCAYDNCLREPGDSPISRETFADYDEAVREVRQLTIESLESIYEPGMSAKDLCTVFAEIGEEVVIRPRPKDWAPFWSWAYVANLAAEMVAAANATSTEGKTNVGEPGEPKHE